MAICTTGECRILLRDTLRLLLGTGTNSDDDGDNIDGDTGDD